MKSKSIDRMEGRTSRLRSPTEHGVDRAGEGTPGLAKGQSSSPWHRRPQVSQFLTLEPRALHGVEGTLASAGERGEGGGGSAGALPGDPDPPSESERGGSPVGSLGPGDDDAIVVEGVVGLEAGGGHAMGGLGRMGLRHSAAPREEGGGLAGRERRAAGRVGDRGSTVLPRRAIRGVGGLGGRGALATAGDSEI